MRGVSLAVVLAVAVAWSGSAAAQQADEPKVFAKRFLDALMSSPVDVAYKIIAEETYLARANKTAPVALREATQKGVLSHGSFVNYELVREQKLGSTYRNIVYLVNHTQIGAVYTMTFYRTPRGWNLVRMDITVSPDKMVFD